MTSLFPADNHMVKIKQGIGGDCYLLASLDCMLNGSRENRNLVKQMFTETPDGGVIVRVKRTGQSSNLKLGHLAGKYTHSRDPSTGDDLFTISKDKLAEIERTSGGVTSNSLAVNILERLSSYYYVGDWDSSAMLASVKAHNINERHDTTSTTFFGKLVGIEANDYKANQINEIIRLKMLKPSEPVYISMDYGEKDENGKIHDRHAFNVTEIKQENGQYTFVLVNPWDNTKTETVSSEEIKKSHPRFCIYSKDPQKHELEMMLTKLPNKEMGKYVIDRPTFFNELLVDKKSPSGLPLKQLEARILQHKAVLEKPYIELETADRSIFRKHLALLDEDGIAGILEKQNEASLNRLNQSYSNIVMKNLINKKLQEKNQTAVSPATPPIASSKETKDTAPPTEVKGQASPPTEKLDKDILNQQYSLLVGENSGLFRKTFDLATEEERTKCLKEQTNNSLKSLLKEHSPQKAGEFYLGKFSGLESLKSELKNREMQKAVAPPPDPAANPSAKEKQPAATDQPTKEKGQVSPLIKKPEPKDASAQFSDESFPKNVKSRRETIKDEAPHWYEEFSSKPLTYYDKEIGIKIDELSQSETYTDKKKRYAELRVLRTEKDDLVKYYEQQANAAAHVQPTQAPPQATPAAPVQPTEVKGQVSPLTKKPEPKDVSGQFSDESFPKNIKTRRTELWTEDPDKHRVLSLDPLIYYKNEIASKTDEYNKAQKIEDRIKLNRERKSLITEETDLLNYYVQKSNAAAHVQPTQAPPQATPAAPVQPTEVKRQTPPPSPTPSAASQQHGKQSTGPQVPSQTGGYRENQSATPVSQPGISKEPEHKLVQAPTKPELTPSHEPTVRMPPAQDTAIPAPSQTSTKPSQTSTAPSTNYKQLLSNVKNQELQKLLTLEEKILNKRFNYHGGGKFDTQTNKTYPQGAFEVLNIIRTLKMNLNPTAGDLDQACKDIHKKLDGKDGKSNSRAYIFDRGGRDIDTAMFYEEAITTVKSVEASLKKPVTLEKQQDEPSRGLNLS